MHAMHVATMFPRARVFAGLVYDSIAPEKFDTTRALRWYKMLHRPQCTISWWYPPAFGQETC
jgi:hypothetical protein